MHSQSWSKVLSQDHTHVHSAEAIRLDDHLPRPEYADDVERALRVASPDNHTGQCLGRISIAEEDHVEASAP